MPSLLCAEFVMGRVCHVPSLLCAELSLNPLGGMLIGYSR